MASLARRALAAGVTSLAVIASAALVGSCREADSILLVTVETDADVVEIAQLRATVSNASMSSESSFPEERFNVVITFPTKFSLTVPHARSGRIDVALDGRDYLGAFVANGAASATLIPGGITSLAITLHAGQAKCGNGTIDPGEQCDDGNRISEGVCGFQCQVAGPGADGGPGGAIEGGTGGTTAGAGGSGAGGARGTGGAPCTMSLLTNGNFDAGQAGWTTTSSNRLLIYNHSSVDPDVVPGPRSSPDLAWLGYDSVSETVTLEQSFQVPANALSLTVSGYFIIKTGETGCDCDDAAIDVLGTTFTHRAHAWSNLDANTDWTLFTNTFDITAVAGSTLTLQLSAKMDDGVITSFFFDDLSVTANFCP